MAGNLVVDQINGAAYGPSPLAGKKIVLVCYDHHNNVRLFDEGVSSITDVDEGDFTVNFETNFANTDYVIAGMGKRPSVDASDYNCLTIPRSGDKTVALCDFKSMGGDTTNFDMSPAHLIFIGD